MAPPTERTTVEMLNHTSGIDGEYSSDVGPDAERIEDIMPRLAGQGQPLRQNRTEILVRPLIAAATLKEP